MHIQHVCIAQFVLWPIVHLMFLGIEATIGAIYTML